MLSKRWIMRDYEESVAGWVGAALNISHTTALILANRGIKDADEAELFLRASLDDLVEPFMLDGVGKGVSRLIGALKEHEKVLIFGDYDADGITSTSLLYLLLKDLGYNVRYHIPERETEGYGLNVDTLRRAAEEGVSLLITVDCGISSLEEIAAAYRMGIDVIITDHHEPPDQMPYSHAIINPHLPGSAYPFKGLAGVGVAMKLAQGLLAGLDGKDRAGPGLDDRLVEYLDLVALGTVADVVPIVGENRILVKHGLDVLRDTKRVGLKKLMATAGVVPGRLNTGTIGFQLAPRLNASGRIGNADISVRLLTTEDPDEAETIAAELDTLNRERQLLEADILSEARAMLEETRGYDDSSIVLSSDRWHQGVIGIVASRLVDEFYRPTVLIALNDRIGKGSARSVPEMHLYEGIQRCEGLLEGFGGHKYAAGLSILAENIKEFKRSFDKVVNEMTGGEELMPSLKIDVEVGMEELGWPLYGELARLAPFGAGNPEPVLKSDGLMVRFPKFVGRNHVKMRLSQDDLVMEAIAFNMGDIYQDLAMAKVYVDAAYCLTVNEFRGERNLQLNVKDLHFPREKCFV